MPSDRDSNLTTWTVIVETPAGAATRDHLGPFLRALLANAAAVAPAASFDAEASALTAHFDVFADTREEAALRGCFAYWGAIAAAGVQLADDSTVLVAPRANAGDAERFSAQARVTRTKWPGRGVARPRPAVST